MRYTPEEQGYQAAIKRKPYINPFIYVVAAYHQFSRGYTSGIQDRQAEKA